MNAHVARYNNGAEDMIEAARRRKQQQEEFDRLKFILKRIEEDTPQVDTEHKDAMGKLNAELDREMLRGF